MHDVELPADLLQWLRERRGKQHVFDHIDAKTTALLVIDMQNGFVHPDGFAYIEKAAGTSPNINRLADALRHAGGTVAWIRATFNPEGRSAWHMYFDNFVPAELRDDWRAQMTPGNHGHEFWHELDIHDDDWIVDKDRFSAMIQGASDLEERLRRHGIDTVLVTGTLTNCCCESTARDAMMRDFRTFMISDANSARTDEDHIAGLRTFVQVFGDVINTDEAVAMIGGQ
ncbi:MAG: cysteine hydrolase [Gammaproteobacteria bacterium]|nr:cysteine hydrolase [Gammaproteobacteria bacterium]